MRLVIAIFVLLFCVAVADAGAAEAGAPEQRPEQRPTAPEPSPVPPASRLRFKGRGPVCMCVDGLSERDIGKMKRDATTSRTEPPPKRNIQQ